jgi:hypothetical protein
MEYQPGAPANTNTVSEREKHIAFLFAAELQFRLASAVRIATLFESQPLDLPTVWTHGRHLVKHKEIALRQDQAEYAAFFLQRAATYLMAVAVREAIPKLLPDYERNQVSKSAYRIAYEIRNAFAHGPFSPTWKLNRHSKDQVFKVPRVISLDTHNLDGKPFDWRDYGGPLALLRLCRFVRIKLLGDRQRKRWNAPEPRLAIYQIGDLILRKVDSIPSDARRVYPAPLPDGSIPIPGCDGYSLRVAKRNGSI